MSNPSHLCLATDHQYLPSSTLGWTIELLMNSQTSFFTHDKAFPQQAQQAPILHCNLHISSCRLCLVWYKVATASQSPGGDPSTPRFSFTARVLAPHYRLHPPPPPPHPACQNPGLRAPFDSLAAHHECQVPQLLL